MKNQKGITLIALVITIIVLIILAGVSINLVLGNNGMITRAKNAKEQTDQAKINEEIQLNETAKYLEGLEENVENTIVNPNPEPILGPTVNDLKAGDYINYDTGKNGVITCRVLYEASSEYGVQIISNKNIKSITLGGSNWETARASYNAAIQKLNTEAEEYLNPVYATDARSVGSVPTLQNGVFVNKNSEAEIEKLPFTPSGWSTNNSGCKGRDANYETDKTQMENANIWITGEKYWLASRYVWTNSTFDFDCFMYGVDSNGLSYTAICDVELDGNTHSYSNTSGLRPCFSLKNGIQITGGNGTSEQPYTM